MTLQQKKDFSMRHRLLAFCVLSASICIQPAHVDAQSRSGRNAKPVAIGVLNGYEVLRARSSYSVKGMPTTHDQLLRACPAGYVVQAERYVDGFTEVDATCLKPLSVKSRDQILEYGKHKGKTRYLAVCTTSAFKCVQMQAEKCHPSTNLGFGWASVVTNPFPGKKMVPHHESNVLVNGRVRKSSMTPFVCG